MSFLTPFPFNFLPRTEDPPSAGPRGFRPPGLFFFKNRPFSCLKLCSRSSFCFYLRDSPRSASLSLLSLTSPLGEDQPQSQSCSRAASFPFSFWFLEFGAPFPLSLLDFLTEYVSLLISFDVGRFFLFPPQRPHELLLELSYDQESLPVGCCVDFTLAPPRI